MENLLSGLEMLARWDVMLALLVGSVGGVIIGAIPGVGPAVAIAILLPATFSMDPIVGLTMLLGIYGSSMYGGAIPAVLINTPGTAVNALTSYDGYPMTQRGEAHRAVSLAYSASFWGGMFGILCLILLSPLLLAQALRTRRRMPRLPEAAGERQGSVGSGPLLRLLVAGDSSAAGVGVGSQHDALAGQLARQLARACHARVQWQLAARTGLSSARTLHFLQREALPPFDIAVLMTGVNDVIEQVPSHHAVRAREALVNYLRNALGVAHVVFGPLPPMHLLPGLPQPLRWISGADAQRHDRALARWAAVWRTQELVCRAPFEANPELCRELGVERGPCEAAVARVGPLLEPLEPRALPHVQGDLRAQFVTDGSATGRSAERPLDQPVELDLEHGVYVSRDGCVATLQIAPQRRTLAHRDQLQLSPFLVRLGVLADEALRDQQRGAEALRVGLIPMVGAPAVLAPAMEQPASASRAARVVPRPAPEASGTVRVLSLQPRRGGAVVLDVDVRVPAEGGAYELRGEVHTFVRDIDPLGECEVDAGVL